jgi:hypothetical protein
MLSYIVAALSKLWMKRKSGQELCNRVFKLPGGGNAMDIFTEKYDGVQAKLAAIASLDDNLISGKG